MGKVFEIVVDITDEDLKKLENGKTLLFAKGIIARTEVEIKIRRLPELNVFSTRATLILRLIPVFPNVITHDELSAKSKLPKQIVNTIVGQLLREGAIYEPREGFLRKT